MNTVTRTKSLLLSALLPLIAAPSLGHAEAKPADASLDACVKAFVSANIEKDRHYSLVTSDASSFDPDAAKHVVTLKATGKSSGKQLAKATCVVDRNGITLTMNGKSSVIANESAVLSAR
ncbi:MAG TPA: hypothetical protein VIT67_12750 [Povalibacter sp.]|jgi:hypothetical protein